MDESGNMDDPSKSVILIVDDEAVNIDVLNGMLQEEYRTKVALGGEKAVQIAISEDPPDVILLDVMMPGMDGFEVCRRLKSDKDRRHIPIVLVTSLDSMMDLAKGLDSGADDFIHKPVDPIELGARVRSMLRIKRQYDELQELIRFRDDLSGMLVHDMRNPLASIRLNIDLLKRVVSEKKATNYLKRIVTSASRLNSFIEDMLLMTKQERGQLTLSRESVDLVNLLRKMADDLGPLGKARNIGLHLEHPEESRAVLIDVNLIQRVIDNLISNAFKFSPDGSMVTFRISYPEEQERFEVRVEVLDEGLGIPDEYKESVFEKFEVAPLKEKGILQTGLGLAFCKMVVDAHGGKIYVRDNQPQGSIFIIEL